MRARTCFALAATAAALGATASSAQAQFGVANDCTTPEGTTCWVGAVYNGDYTGMDDRNYLGAPAQDAGAHPFVGVTDFRVATSAGAPDGTVSSIRVDVPAGLVSNPQAAPKCSDTQLAAGSCPANTQLGIIKLESFAGGVDIYVGASVYNLPPEASNCAGYTSDYAFYVSALSERVNICGTVTRQPPYNLYYTIKVPPGAATVSSTLVLWGIPADSGHNPQRGWSCLQVGAPCTAPASGPSVPRGAAFLTNPTGCVPAGQLSTLTLDSTTGQQARATSPTAVPAIGCRALRFAPRLTLALRGRHQTAVGRHPRLVAVVRQGTGQANFTFSKVTLPLSLALDPDNSQHVCSVAAAANDSCPAGTLIGTARATTPLVSRPLSGRVYLVQGIRTTSTGQRIRTLPALLVELRGQAAIDLHAQTSVSRARLVTTFSKLPDLPVSSLTLTINGGRRGILVITGSHSLCARRQVASILLVGQNGRRERHKVRISTPCAASKRHGK